MPLSKAALDISNFRHRNILGALAVGGLALGLRLWGLVASPDGTRVVRADATGKVSDPEALGARVARMLDERGAGDILQSIPDAAVPRLSHP